jgi:DNA-binding transcriptional MerR regulator
MGTPAIKHDYLTEEQAASYACVSVNTLRRYAEAGYLNIQKNNDNSVEYSAQELAKVFELQDLSLNIANTTINNQTNEDSKVNLVVTDTNNSDELSRTIVAQNALIEDLKEQRAWLQRRVEKLEEQGDKDKVLLLRSTHTLQQLALPETVSKKSLSKKSLLRKTLEYLGLAESQVVKKLDNIVKENSEN